MVRGPKAAVAGATGELGAAGETACVHEAHWTSDSQRERSIGQPARRTVRQAGRQLDRRMDGRTGDGCRLDCRLSASWTGWSCRSPQSSELRAQGEHKWPDRAFRWRLYSILDAVGGNLVRAEFAAAIERLQRRWSAHTEHRYHQQAAKKASQKLPVMTSALFPPLG